MTVGQLKAILSQYSDDTKVKITYECDNSFRDITKVRDCGELYPFISIETDEVPNYEDLSLMADAALSKYEMLDYEIDALSNLVVY